MEQPLLLDNPGNDPQIDEPRRRPLRRLISLLAFPGVILTLGSLAHAASPPSGSVAMIGWVGAVLDTTDAPPPPPSGRVRLDLTPESSAVPPNADININSDMDLDMEARYKNGDHDFTAWGRYNRVEGVAIFAALRRKITHRDFYPGYKAELGFGFAEDRGQYLLGFEQPIAPRGKVTLGADGYRSNLTFFYSKETLSSGENTASGFFLHKDYWDWFQAEGLRGYFGFYPSPFFSIDVGITEQDETSLHNTTDWSLFNQTADFVSNPQIKEGQLRAFNAFAAYDSRPTDWRGKMRPRSAWGGVEYWYRAGWERADGGLGGDFDFWRITADLRTYFRVSSRQVIATRIFAGTGEDSSGLLPPQRRFFLGGLGTLRGQNYRSAQGDNAVMANVEYGFALTRRGKAEALFFIDSGVAWDEGSLSRQFIPVDVGTGLRAGSLTILLATQVNRSSDAKVYIRFQESF
jgi:hypothetical protein